MKLKLQLIIESDTGEAEMVREVTKLERYALRPEALGLTRHTVQLIVGTGQTATLCLRLSAAGPEKMPDPFTVFDQTFATRLREANGEFRHAKV